ncbi:MAG: hypothetical protein H7327_12690 [Herminiimonas sp.]|nr:hypothetical protein [Herminiimonas sp.]
MTTVRPLPADVSSDTAAGLYRRVAAIVGLPPIGADAGTVAAAVGTTSALADLADTGLLEIDFSQTRFTGADAARTLSAAFESIAAQHRQQPYDALLVLGTADVEPDVGLMLTVLAPCIEQCGIAVLTAVGSDDANTILGDVAQQVFPHPAALIEFVAARLIRRPVAAGDLLGRIRSLADFLLVELRAESRILLDAAVRPALLRHLEAHTRNLQRWQRRVVAATAQQALRLTQEIDALHALKSSIDRLVADRTEQRRQRSRRALVRLRVLSILLYAALAGLLYATLTPAQALFFGACALVLLSAVYTSLADSILADIEAIPVQAGSVRLRQPTSGADPTAPSLLRISPGAIMNEQPNEHVTRAYRDAADENLLLGAILQRLEQSDRLSLDELDAIILQADAAYKARLARLEHTRSMIARLGASETPT